MVVVACFFEVIFGGTLELDSGGLPIVALALALREAKYALIFSFFCSSCLTWRSALVA